MEIESGKMAEVFYGRRADFGVLPRGSHFVPLALRFVIILFFVSGFFGVMVRFWGELSGVGVLRDTLPIKFVNICVAIGVCILTLFSGLVRTSPALVYISCFAILLLTNLVHLVFGEPALTDAWNTIPFEFLRFFSLGWYVYAGFLISGSSGSFVKRALFLAVISCSLMVVFAVFQKIGMLPNFYFQWYSGVQVPRPTGGMEHPHFFALLLVLATCMVTLGMEKGLLTSRHFVIFVSIFFIGILISTSRVGLISGVLFLLSYSFLRYGLSKIFVLYSIALFVAVVGVLLVLLNWAIVSQWGAVESAFIFISAFQESFSADSGDGSFLRGRGERWAHELELITASPTTLFFGYGHQPFVSHNLVLRQLQVSGIVGTVCYLLMVLAFIRFWLVNISKDNRAAVYSIIFSFGVASITFPVFVSVTIACGFVLLVAISMLDRTQAVTL